MHIPNTDPLPEYIKKTKTAPERRHYVDKFESERESKMLKEDLSMGWKEKSTYAGEFGKDFDLHTSFQEPRFVRPKLDANANLEKMTNEKAPTQSEVDKFLYVSLYQDTFDPETKISPFKEIEKKARFPHGKSKATSLYQDTYEDPIHQTLETHLRDNKSNRTGYLGAEPEAKSRISTLLHLVKEPCTTTSYFHDYKTSHPMVEAGEGPSFAKTSHPLQTREIVAKAFKYRRY
ncbi:hypothetical protein HDU79_002775 [Rhizoclosmatium sp. JEL0117]|nr:hypothetical protein HDU79_002775 [Rhizoclosmatium sp. JEL0117]